MHDRTPLARWLNRSKSRTVLGTARALGISRPRLYHYINGAAEPSGAVLDGLIKITGLSASAFKRIPKQQNGKAA